MADGAIGYATNLYTNDPDGATPTVADQLLTGITSVTLPSPSRDIIDVTHTGSANMAREFIVGLIDYGEATADLIWVPDNTTDQLLREASVETTPRIWKVEFTQITGTPAVTFDAYVTSFEATAPLEDKLTATLNLKVTGAPAWAP